jgi:primary-amine oxidase
MTYRAQIASVCLSVRKHTAEKTAIKAVRFLTCYLLPPPKKDVLAFLGISLAPGEKPQSFSGTLVRKAEVDVRAVFGMSFRVYLRRSRSSWTS